MFIITQNVDDLHEKAGSHRIVHIHGSIWKVICLNDNKVLRIRGFRYHSFRRSVSVAEFCGRESCGSMKTFRLMLARR